MANKQSALWRLLLLAMVGALLGLSVYNWNARTILGNRMPMPFGYGVSVVLSGSMEPSLSVNDMVVIRQTERIAEGDIIVYQSGQSLVIHRVVAVNGRELITQGDANNAPDEPISLDAVKGRLLFAIPGLGALVQLLQNPWVILLLECAAVVLMELSYRREKEKDSQELDKIQQEIRQLLEEVKEEN